MVAETNPRDRTESAATAMDLAVRIGVEGGADARRAEATERAQRLFARRPLVEPATAPRARRSIILSKASGIA